MTEAPDCPLCGRSVDGRARIAHGRRFHDCPGCGLVFADPSELPSASDERARYATHENDPDDPGYRDFLDRLATPLAARLPPGAEGLDFGCGPGPTLSGMLTERGHPTRDWDPFFAPDDALLERTWDFVSCSEVLEHLHRPAGTLARMDALLRPGGWLGVMTGILEDDVVLEEWWYARDPTHVAFYRPRTLAWIAARFGWEMERPRPNVVLYRKPGAADGAGPSDREAERGEQRQDHRDRHDDHRDHREPE